MPSRLNYALFLNNVTMQPAIAIESVPKFQPPVSSRCRTLCTGCGVHALCMQCYPYSRLGHIKMSCNSSRSSKWTTLYCPNDAFFLIDILIEPHRAKYTQHRTNSYQTVRRFYLPRISGISSYCSKLQRPTRWLADCVVESGGNNNPWNASDKPSGLHHSPGSSRSSSVIWNARFTGGRLRGLISTYNSATPENRTQVDTNFSDHNDLGNHIPH